MKGAKAAGRPKGAINKVSRPVKEVISNLLSDYSNSGLMESDFAELEPKDRMQMAEKFIQYIMPKMQSVAMSGDAEKPVTIEARLAELARKPDEK